MERRSALRADLRRRPAEHQPRLPRPPWAAPPASPGCAGASRASSAGSATPPPATCSGHKDGTANPRAGTAAFDDAVWVSGPDEPSWFTGGTYLVFRKIRMDLPKWDTSTALQQDQSIGRRRDTGAPLSGGHEFTPPDFGRAGPDGEPCDPVRLPPGSGPRHPDAAALLQLRLRLPGEGRSSR
ncbi:Dyp-type peroxidase [Nonomuraea dietziae]|uniref:Dyp-type peroxidase n=1 Tax=Nonomuraea dietziae TaxID=65515 RepID=UPI003CD0B641